MDTRARIFSFFGSRAEKADFAEIYRQEVPRIYNFFRFRVGDSAQAEDLTSDTFEKAWQNREQSP